MNKIVNPESTSSRSTMEVGNNLEIFLTKYLNKLIIVITLILSLTSLIYYANEKLLVNFGDSKGHLNIARRVVDSPTSGLSQLGAYWLPFLHVLMLPFINIDFFWHTGLAGIIPNVFFFVLLILYVYKLAFLLSKDRFSSIVASLICLLNPNLLYLQVTPMTEVIFTSTTVIGIYYLSLWISSKSTLDLLKSASFLMLASMTRYEGWGVVIACSFVILLEWIVRKFNAKWEGSLIIFSTLAFFGIVTWIVWGALLVHDPLDFLRNAQSAKNQTAEAYDLIETTGKHNIAMAFATSYVAIKHTVGPVFFVLLPIATLIFLVKAKFTIFRIKTNHVLILLVPFLFDVLTVFLGAVPIEVPEFSHVPAPGNYFNIRYSVFTIPAIAIFLILVSKKKWYQSLLLIFAILSFFYLTYISSPLVVFEDAGSSGISEGTRTTADWFKKNYDNGYVLASTGGTDGLMFDIGLPLKNYIVEGSYKYWDQSLAQPNKYAKWIFIDSSNKRDSVNKNIDKKLMYDEFSVVFQNNTFQILKRK